jgi:hypothetical protein
VEFDPGPLTGQGGISIVRIDLRASQEAFLGRYFREPRHSVFAGTYDEVLREPGKRRGSYTRLSDFLFTSFLRAS